MLVFHEYVFNAGDCKRQVLHSGQQVDQVFLVEYVLPVLIDLVDFLIRRSQKVQIKAEVPQLHHNRTDLFNCTHQSIQPSLVLKIVFKLNLMDRNQTTHDFLETGMGKTYFNLLVFVNSHYLEHREFGSFLFISENRLYFLNRLADVHPFLVLSVPNVNIIPVVDYFFLGILI